VEEVEAVFDDLLIDWVASSPTRLALTSPSPSWRHVVQPGVTIIAIIRGDQTITAPEPSEVLRAGDRLGFVSRRQDLGPFHILVG
jgi:K+/H+ antiporter YhaU regulatory subunit KhtT